MIPSSSSTPMNKSFSASSSPASITAHLNTNGIGLNNSNNISSSSFNYHHENSKFSSNQSTKDHTSLFKKSLLHKWHYKHSILCIVASPKRKLLFCGTQNSSIIVLDLITFQLKFEIPCHVGSVLCLHLSDCENILFSGGSDSLVKIWKIEDTVIDSVDSSSIQLIPTHTIYSLLDVGDIFSITWIEDIKTIFFGAQNASLSFVHIDTQLNSNSSVNDHLKLMPSNRFDKFFDSKGSSNVKNLQYDKSNTDCIIDSDNDNYTVLNQNITVIQVPSENIIPYAHNGYLYAIDYLKIDNPLTSNIGNNIAENYKYIIISAGGDGEIKLWGYEINSSSLTLLKSLINSDLESIFSLTVHKQTLTVYAGLSNGNICIWDLTTFQLLKTFLIDPNDVYTVALSPPINGNHPQWLLMGTEFGITKKLLSSNSSFDNNLNNNLNISDFNTCVRVTKNDPCLTLRTFQINNESFLISAGSDKTISLWSLESMSNTCEINDQIENHQILSKKFQSNFSNDNFFKILHELITFRTVSKQPDIFMSECRKCANYLMILFKSFGAFKTKLLPVPNGNPIVYAEFKANSNKVSNKSDNNGDCDISRILWYGHYDVIPASKETWNTSPFTMTPQDGYFYGRGVTDNKGPLLCSIFAISELYSNNELESDVIFIIEGEEEAGSWGFQKVITEFKDEILEFNKSIDWILLSNSYWLDDKIPVLNYGLRGKIEIELEVWSDKPDRHSGVDGGVLIEPSMDLVKLLSKLVENDKIVIPGFEEIYGKNTFKDSITILKEWEKPLYKEISDRVPNLDINELIRKWRLPSLTLHKIEMSGPDNGTVISQKSEAKLSIRIIPEQEINDVKNSFIEFINKCFKDLKSSNHLDIKIMDEAEPWLGDVNNLAFKTLYECIKEEWGIKPLFVREGGSIPSIRFLEKLFDCSAVHVPTGQSSDNAHLNNERVRIINLLKSKEIIKKAANRLPKSNVNSASI